MRTPPKKVVDKKLKVWYNNNVNKKNKNFKQKGDWYYDKSRNDECN